MNGQEKLTCACTVTKSKRARMELQSFTPVPDALLKATRAPDGAQAPRGFIRDKALSNPAAGTPEDGRAIADPGTGLCIAIAPIRSPAPWPDEKGGDGRSFFGPRWGRPATRGKERDDGQRSTISFNPIAMEETSNGDTIEHSARSFSIEPARTWQAKTPGCRKSSAACRRESHAPAHDLPRASPRSVRTNGAEETRERHG